MNILKSYFFKRKFYLVSIYGHEDEYTICQLEYKNILYSNEEDAKNRLKSEFLKLFNKISATHTILNRESGDYKFIIDTSEHTYMGQINEIEEDE